MFGIDDAIIAGVASAAIGGLSSWFGQSSANKTNVNLAREQMAFQERMSGSAYQRSIADMRSAGLNPMLLARGSSGASTPSGSMPIVQSTTQGIPASLNTALQVYTAKANLDNARATNINIAADTALKATQAQVASNTAKKINAETSIVQANLHKARLYGEGYEAIQNVVNTARDVIRKADIYKSSFSPFKPSKLQSHSLKDMVFNH